MTNDTISIIKFFKNLWAVVKDFTFKARIVNQVEMPEIVIPEVHIPEYPDSIEVNNLTDYTSAIKGSSSDIIRYLDGALRKLEPVKDKRVIVLLEEIKKVVEKRDVTPEIISEIRNIVKSLEKSLEKSIDKSIDKKDIDLSGIERKFSGLKKDLLKFTRYDEIKVRLPDKQVKEMGKAIVASGGGSSNVTDTLGHQVNPATKEKQDDIITAVNNISGLQRSTDMYGTGLVSVGTTPVEVEISGTTESISIQYPAITDNTGQLYIGKSNVTSAGANAIQVLLPGESIEMDYNDTSNAIYVVSDTASQYFIAGGLL